jgi:hypothetical protein
MDQELARQLISREPNVLSKAAEEDAKLYANLRCPMCYQSGCRKQLLPVKMTVSEEGIEPLITPFGDGMIPEGHAVCILCETIFDPKSGIIIHSGPTMTSSP